MYVNVYKDRERTRVASNFVHLFPEYWMKVRGKWCKRMTMVGESNPGNLKWISQVFSQVGITLRKNYEVKMAWKLFILITVLGRGKYLSTIFIKPDINRLLPIRYFPGNLDKLSPISWMC